MIPTPLRPLNRTCRFEHTGRYGTKLEATSMDLMTKNVITRPKDISDAKFAADLLQIFGWFAEQIKPAFLMDHGGWPGYDCVSFEVRRIEECIEVEYDEEYSGGNYSGVGKKVMIPWRIVDEIGCVSKDDVNEAFQKVTGLNPIHIVHYSNEIVEAAVPETYG